MHGTVNIKKEEGINVRKMYKIFYCSLQIVSLDLRIKPPK
jgi:hypothetical protein